MIPPVYTYSSSGKMSEMFQCVGVLKELPPNCVHVSINQMIDASTFWVVDSSSSTELHELESTLLKAFKLCRDGCDFLPEDEEMVSVKDPDSGRCYRGIVRNVLQTTKGFKYVVFLVDHGISLTISNTYIRQIPHSMLRVKWRSYQIELYGIIPTSVAMNFEKDKFERIVTSEWTEAAINFVHSAIKRHKVGYFKPRLGLEENKLFGELYVSESNGYANLGDVLVKMEFAVREERLFKELADVEYAYIKQHGNRNWLISDAQTHSDSYLIGKKWSIIQNYVEVCQKDLNQNSDETKRKEIEEWRDNCQRALENEIMSLNTARDPLLPKYSSENGPSKNSALCAEQPDSLKKSNDSSHISDLYDDVLENYYEPDPVPVKPPAVNHVNSPSLLDMIAGDKAEWGHKEDAKKSHSNDVGDKTNRVPLKPSVVNCVKSPSLLDMIFKAKGDHEKEAKKSHSNSSRCYDIVDETEPVSLKFPQVNHVESSLLLDLNFRDKEDVGKNFSSGVADASVKQEHKNSQSDKLLGQCELIPKVVVEEKCASSSELYVSKHTLKKSPPRLVPAGASMNAVTITQGCSVEQSKTEKHVSHNSTSPSLNTPLAGDPKRRQLSKSGHNSKVLSNTAHFVPSTSLETCSSGSSNISSSETPTQAQEAHGAHNSTKHARRPKLTDILKLHDFCFDTSMSEGTFTAAERLTSHSDDRNNVKSSQLESITLPTSEESGLQENPRRSTVAGHLRINPVLVHGEGKSVKPLLSISQASFPPEIHKALYRCKLNDPMRIQRFAWPIILTGHNLIMVSPLQSGKTLAYLAPLLGFILQKDTYNNLPKGCGPLVLVLCSSSSSAQNVYDVCTEIIDEFKEKLTVLITYGGGAETEQMMHLLNGCDILISTPRCLLRLIDHVGRLTNLKRVAHLVFDEADILSLKYLPEMKDILMRCNVVVKKRKGEACGMQIIAASQKWCPALESLARVIPKPPTICIASCLEAVVYARLQPNLHYIDDVNRASTVKDILKKQLGLYKTVVVCQSSVEVEKLSKFLEPDFDNLVIAHEDIPHFRNDDVLKRWNQAVAGCYLILVCSDNVLYDLKLQDAAWIIHYSLPPDSKTVFGFRFSCLMDNFRDMIKPEQNEVETPDCMVHILLDETSTQQLPPIVHLMKRLGVSIDKHLEEVSAEAEEKRDMKKGDVPLCYNIQAFGDCWDKSSCPYRHLIKIDSDSPRENLPVNGIVKLKVLHVHDACNMSARLLEHTDLGGITKSIPDQFISICFRLNRHFKNANNRILHGNPKIKDICAVECGLNVFQRAQVLSVTKSSTSGDPEKVIVKYLDHGKLEAVKVLKLLALPEDLQKLPPQVVEIYVCRLSPCDLDWSWGRAVTLKVSDWLKDGTSVGDSEGKYIQGQIVLSLNDSLWLDPLECRRSLPMVGTSSIIFTLRHHLLKANLAVDNPHHINNLHKLCIKAGMTLPPYTFVSTPQKKVPASQTCLPVEVQWAFLPGEELDDVFLCTAQNPSLLFVRVAKWEENLEKLKKDLQNIRQLGDKCEKSLKPGDFCLGKFPVDGLWYRAQVMNVDEDSVSLFFVDYGDTASIPLADIAPIPVNYLACLPFQAIECTLVGVKPVEGDTWTEEATDVLYDVTTDNDGDFVKLQNLRVCQKVKPAMFTGGFRYSIVLWDGTDNAKVINKLLVDRGLGAFIEEETYFLETGIEDSIPVSPTENENKKNSCELQDSFVSTESEKSIVDPLEIDTSAITSEINENSGTELLKLDNTCTELALPDPKTPENMQIATLKTVTESDNNMNFFETCEECDPEDLMLFCISLEKHSKQVNETENKKADVCTASSVIYDEPPKIVDITPSKDTEPQEQMMEDVLPILMSTTRQPKVLWSEDNYYVTLKIMLIGVEKYYIYCDMETFKFSTNFNGEVYLVYLRLFGVVDLTTVSHDVRGQYVFVRLKKLLEGYDWGCLLKDKGDKPLWLSYDLEATEIKDNRRSSTAEALCKQARGEGPAELFVEEGEEDVDEEDDGLAADIVDSDDEMFDINDPLS